jgi:hypothetical protein
MSDFSSAAAVIPAPAASPAALESAGASVLIEPSNDTGDDGGFDADSARAAAAEMLRGGDEAPPEAPEKPVDEKTTEELSEEERLAARKQKLSDEKGKLSQDKLDNAFAKLTAEGKRLRAKVEAHKAERATFETAKAQYDAAIEKAAERVNGQEKEWNDFREQAKTSPLTVLEKLGWSVPKLIKFIENDGKHTPEDQLAETKTTYDKRFEELQRELESTKSSLKQREFKTAASQYEANATAKMAELMPKYEYISKYDLKTEVAPKVLQNIAHIYREGGQVGDKTYPKGTALDPQVILDYFEAQTAKEVSRFGVRPGQAGAANSAAKPGAAQPKTLSNADTSSRSVKQNTDDEEFDRDDAWRKVQGLLG